MSPDEPDQPLSDISTLWTVVHQAHGGAEEAVTAAQKLLMLRYGKAVRRYLLGALHNVHAAEELSQEFAVRFLQGDLRGACPERGSFRNFVKGVLSHLIADYHRRQQRQPQPLPENARTISTTAQPAADFDRQFLTSWRDQLLADAWESLDRIQQESGQQYYSVLRFRAQYPEARSAAMAEKLSGQLGKPVTADWVRQMLHRAREKFADLLVRAIMETLEQPTVEDVEQELSDLGLLEYCRNALQRLRG
jgi:RNA polymerase sigma-70 factor (ECF subfamily)